MAYKIRRITKESGELVTASLGLPNEIASELPTGLKFDCELTDEGILFRPAAQRATSSNRPQWLDEVAAGSNGVTEAPKRVRATAKK